MTYTATHFRKNMWEILDDIRINRKIWSIGRRNKREFMIIPIEVWEDYDYDTVFDMALSQTMENVSKKGDLPRFDTLISNMETQWKL